MHRDVECVVSKSRLRSIANHNAKTNVSAANFSIGDWILLRRARKSTHKLSFVWGGPYRIVECKSDLVYVVEPMNRSTKEIVHARRMILYRADMDGKDVSEDLLRASEHLTTKYQISEAIRDIGLQDEDIMLRIEWQGLPDENEWTWEPLSQAYEDIPDDVRSYLDTKNKRKLKEAAKKQLRLL